MIARSSGATRTVRHSDDLLVWANALRAGRIDVVVDAGLIGRPDVDQLVRSVQQCAQSGVVIPVAARSTADVAELADLLRPATAVVAVGGGSVLDRTKLAVRSLDVDAARQLALDYRSALVLLAPAVRAMRPLAAVPTTIGTGSEVSKAAVHVTGHGRRLVVGEGLQPDLALHDPAMTRSLPRWLLAEGVLEVFARLIGPYVGDARPRRVDDALVETCVRVLVPLLVAVAEARAAGTDVADDVRADILRIGAVAHGELLASARSPYAVKWWPVTNEICAELGVRKMGALAAVLPVFFATISSGDLRFGSAERLGRLWSVVRDSCAYPLPDDPADGVRALLALLQVAPDPALFDMPVDAIAQRLSRGWGAGLPMLAGIRIVDLRHLLDRSTNEARAISPRREKQPSQDVDGFLFDTIRGR